MQTSRFKQILSLAAIVVLAGATGMFAEWRAPNISAQMKDWLMQARGAIEPPGDIVIVAIDEASIKRLGRFPWRRELIAAALEKISASQPKVIALNILYSEPTDEENDALLAEAIRRSGNVVAAAQLIEAVDESDSASPGVAWLRPLPAVEAAAAGVGHANIPLKSDGTAREILLRMADNDGQTFWALAAEVVRVGDKEKNIEAAGEAVLIGARKIPVESETEKDFLAIDTISNLEIIPAQTMRIDYVGAAGAFQSYSFADVLEDKIAAENFRGRYVLIGATAATLGEKIASPFVGSEDEGRGRQNATLMPGVEVLANAVNTILRGRFYRETSDWQKVLLSVLVAAAVLHLLWLAQGRFEWLKQILVLAGLLALVLLVSYFAFTKAFLILPLVPMLISFAVAAPLALLRRSLATSAKLDARIEELAEADAQILPEHSNAEIAASQRNLKLDFPRGAEWKAERLGVLQRSLLGRARFVDRALRSVEDGLLVADKAANVAFANRRAAEIFSLTERGLLGANLFRLLETEAEDANLNADEILRKLLLEREPIEREIAVGAAAGAGKRFFILRISTVVSEDDENLGLVATLSDITRQRELQETKNDVMALVTHELRTPLTAIQGMSELLAQFDVKPEKRREMLETINDEAKRLAQMVEEYLDITRLESGARPLRLTPVKIASLIHRVRLIIEPVAAQKQIKITEHLPPDLPVIQADADLLSRALTNLLANAVKYGAARSEIHIGAKTEKDFLKISIKDAGRGIPPDALPRIFEKFYRVPRIEDAEEISGSGLGLALVREIAERHGGSVGATSEENIGSIFILKLPIDRSEPGAVATG